VKYVRTPDSRFEDLQDYAFEPHYVSVPDHEGGKLRMHYLDEGPRDGEVILCLHGQPTWSFLYRHMVPIFGAAGYRVIAPDFVGFGRSDKPLERNDYTYANHVSWLASLVEQAELRDVTLVCQDWGGLIGLRYATQDPDRFARIVAANTGLPDANGVDDGDVNSVSERMRARYSSLPVYEEPQAMALGMMSDPQGMGFLHWVKFCADAPILRVSDVVRFSSGGNLGADDAKGYDAPFPSNESMAGARQFPSLVPIIPDNPAIPANREAWKVLENWVKPFLTAFSDSDPVTAGAHVRFQESVPGAKNQDHVTIEGVGHFLQEQAPAALSEAVIEFIKNNPLPT
jgi:haloalkane dehalogenase